MAKTFYDLEVVRSNGDTIGMKRYEGQPLLIVNVASKCGFTPQYEGLEKLQQTYKDRGLRILAFPSNDFGGQEPGTMEEIEQFCKLNYGVTFDLFQKVHATGDDRHPLYRWLTAEADPAGDVQWNFEKFLIDRSGQVVARFSSKTAPDDAELTAAVERVL